MKLSGSPILWGRFGGLDRESLSSILEKDLVTFAYEPDNLMADGLNSEGEMSILQLLSRAWSISAIDPEFVSTINTDAGKQFRESQYYVTGRLLYEHHYKRHFIRYGWMPATNLSLETFNTNTNLISHILGEINPPFIVFETPPHNSFDTLLYFVARTLGIDCFVARDNGYLGGFRLFVNPLDSWPHSTFQEIVLPPPALAHSFEDSAFLKDEIRKNTDILHRQLKKYFFPSTWQAVCGFVSSGFTFIKKIIKVFGFRPSPKLYSEEVRTSEFWKKTANIFEFRSHYTYEFFDRSWFARRFSKLLNTKFGYSRFIIQGDSIDLNQPYIYFSFAFQPEQTTSLLGLQYEDHYLFLSELLKIVPEGLTIICRDYPLHDWPNSLPRDRKKWQAICKNERIKFSPQSTNVQSLIDNCRATALVNGSAGYEALLSSKPVIYGGAPDYAEVTGTTHISKLSNGTDFYSWVEKAQSDLNALKGEPRSVLAELMSSSFSGWMSLTETLSDSALTQNMARIREFLVWLISHKTSR